MSAAGNVNRPAAELAPASSFGAASLGSLVAMEVLKLRKRRMTIIVFTLATVVFAGLIVLAYLLTRMNSETNDMSGFLLPEMIPNAFGFITSLGPIVLVVVAASMMGSEYSWGTVRVLVGSGASRTRLLSAKLVTLVLLAALLLLTSVAAATATSVGLAVAGGHDLSFGWLDAEAAADIGMMFARSLLVVMVPSVLAFAVAVVSRSLAAGVAIGIGYLIAEIMLSALFNALGGVGDSLTNLLISVNSSAITRWNTFGTPSASSDAPDPWQAAGVLALYVAVFIAIAFSVFRRRDVTSG